jgi:hypothetical protein
MSPPSARAELIAWARLARAPRVGAVTFGRLLVRYSTPIAAMEGLARFEPEAAAAAPSADDIEAELQVLEAMGAHLVARMEPHSPAQLASLAAPPPLLAMRSNLTMGQRPAIALVGSRDASAAGMQMAERLAGELGENGFVIVSGLARGIDTAAHQASLAHGTIAMLAGGLDKPYPPLNLDLHNAIVEIRPGRCRNQAWDKCARRGLSATQSDHCRVGAGGDCGRGGSARGCLDHGAGGARFWPRSDGGAGLAAGSTRAGAEWTDQGRRCACGNRRGRVGSDRGLEAAFCGNA